VEVVWNERGSTLGGATLLPRDIRYDLARFRAATAGESGHGGADSSSLNHGALFES